MVGDDAFRERSRLSARLPHKCDERFEYVGLEDVGLALKDVADPLEPHACIDRWALQRNQASVGHPTTHRLARSAFDRAALVVLGKDQVPELGEAVAVVGNAVFAAAAELAAAIPPDLRVGTARSCAEAPPVVFAPSDVLCGHARLLDPDVVRLVIGWMDGHAETVDWHVEDLGDQVPREWDRGFLEVLTGRSEVAQHLEEG